MRQALAKDPDKRFATANDMLKALERALSPAVRATTDEDVALFVREMLVERLQKRRKAIKEAMALADRRTTHPDDSASFAPLVGPDVESSSQTSSVVGLGPDAFMATTASGRSRVQTEGTASRIATTFTMHPGSSARPLVVIGAIAAGLIALVVAGGFFLRRPAEPSGSQPATLAAPAPPTVSATTSPSPPPEPTEIAKSAETPEPIASTPAPTKDARARDRRSTTKSTKKKTASPITTPGF